MQLVDKLGDKYQVDELAAKYEFTGREPMTVPQALAIKEELEKIDELLKQLEEARRRRRSASSTWSCSPSSPSRATSSSSSALQQQVQDYLREMAEQQGLEQSERGSFRLTPKAYRLFQGKLLERMFSDLEPSRTGRHQGPIVGEGAVELQQTKPYEFGDSIRTWTSRRRSSTRLLRGGPRTAGAAQAGRHSRSTARATRRSARRRADGHERLDALRRAVHQREADGPGARRPDPHGVSGRLPAVHRDVLRSPSRGRPARLRT